jgi:hypothetical protein
MKGLQLSAFAPHQASPEEFEDVKRATIAEVATLCGSEEVIAAAYFRQGGAGAQQGVGRLTDELGGLGLGFLARKGIGAARKKRAGGLPRSMLLAVTPKRLYAFDTSYRIAISRREREHGRPTEVEAWDRVEVEFRRGTAGDMTTLVINPLGGGATATVIGGSTADDPWSLEVIDLLAPDPSLTETL